jgi:hypothetical protein
MYIVVCLFALKPTPLDFSDHVLSSNVIESGTNIPKIVFLACTKEGSCNNMFSIYYIVCLLYVLRPKIIKEYIHVNKAKILLISLERQFLRNVYLCLHNRNGLTKMKKMLFGDIMHSHAVVP